MKIWNMRVIYTADDEEPDCMMCDHCQGSSLCEECGPEHYWHYYERAANKKNMAGDEQ